MRVHLVLLGAMVLGGAVPVACGGEPTTNFGPADGIVGRAAPQPTLSSTSTATSTATGTATTPPADDADTPPDDDGGTTTGAESGAPATCPVSWANDVFPLLESTGSGACGSATCHASGGQVPSVLDGNPAGTYTGFTNLTVINNIPYIAPGNTSAAASAMDCNLVTATCGPAMPVSPTGTLSQAQKTTIDTWIKCGAPQN